MEETHYNADPTLDETRVIVADMTSKDKARKILGFFASLWMHQDWKATQTIAENRSCTWETFLKKMRAYYKPTMNTFPRRYEFLEIS